MSYPQTAPSTPIPLPLGGMNARDPIATMDAIYSPWLLNVNPETKSIKVRPAYKQYCETNYAVGLVTYGSKASTTGYKLLCASFYDAAGSGGDSYSVTDITTPASQISLYTSSETPHLSAIPAYPLKFSKRSAFIHGVGVSYSGGVSASLTGFTGLSATENVGLSYKGRVYLFSGTDLYYSGLEAVTGAMSKISLDAFFSEASDIAWAAQVSAPGERPAELSMAIGNGAGEILIYGGDYPGSATWSITGRYRTAPPLGYGCTIDYNNDTWILTENGVVSLMDLMVRGSTAANDTNVSDLIDPYWRKIVQSWTSGSPKPPSGGGILVGGGYSVWSVPATGAYWPEENKIYILLPGHVNRDDVYSSDVATMFVYNCTTKAWSIHSLSELDGTSVSSMTYFNGTLYFIAGGRVYSVDPESYADKEISVSTPQAYGYSIDSAASNFGTGNGKRIHGVTPTLKTDFGKASVAINVISDFGRKTSAQASVSLSDGYNKPLFSVGGEGDDLQVRFSGNTDTNSTDGLELYAMRVTVK